MSWAAGYGSSRKRDAGHGVAAACGFPAAPRPGFHLPGAGTRPVTGDEEAAPCYDAASGTSPRADAARSAVPPASRYPATDGTGRSQLAARSLLARPLPCTLTAASAPLLDFRPQSACQAAWRRARQLPARTPRAANGRAHTCYRPPRPSRTWSRADLGATDRPCSGRLTAPLVLQASHYQIPPGRPKKVAAVTAGVLMAVRLSALVPYTWWLLAVVIASALRWPPPALGDDLLEFRSARR